MGISETLEKNKTAATIAAVALIALAVAYIVYQQRPGNRLIESAAYFTTDDGETWFVDDIGRIPPFDHKGKVASRVKMYSCDGGATKFVGYLERFTPPAKAKLEKAVADGGGNLSSAELPFADPDIQPGGVELKKPGPGNKWVAWKEAKAYAAVLRVTCPDGSSDALDVVLP